MSLRLVQIGAVAVRDVQAMAIPCGRVGTNLLKMSYWSRLRAFNRAGTRLRLRGG